MDRRLLSSLMGNFSQGASAIFAHLSRWLKGGSPRRQDRAKDRKNRARPYLEGLEERCAPAVFNVNSNADLLTPPVGTVTLRSAIQAANATPGNNTINLTIPGTYQITLVGTPGESDNLAGEFAIIPNAANTGPSTLLIQNTSGGTVIVDANHLNRVFDINPGNTNNPATKLLVTMAGFTIQNGVAFPGDAAPGSGGGIRDQGNANLTLFNMTVANNAATADGGGISMENAPVSTPWTLTINASTIDNNHAGDAGGGVETDGTGKVFINAGTVISGNTCLNQGAGIWLDAIGAGSADLTIRGALISNNTATNGPTGGIGNAGSGTVIIDGSTVANNFSGTTGGGFGDQNNLGTLTVTSSVFQGNSAVGDGGGIQEGGPTTTITNSLIQGNTSGGSGGGIFASGTTLTVQQSTVADNTAGVAGGGIEVETIGTDSAITNVTLTGNRALNNAGASGGGIDAPTNFPGGLALIDDTINGNFADNGGGIFWAGTTGTSVTVEDTILAQNTASAAGPDADNPAGAFTDQGGNLIGVSGAGSGNSGFTAGTTQTGTVASPLNPQLGPLANNGGNPIGDPASPTILQTEAPQPFSPAVDKGVANPLVTTDERGVPRPDSKGADTGLQDVGAFETYPLTGNAALVQTLYYDFLGRTGDTANPNDAGAWVNALNAGLLTPLQVATAISRSPEALGVVVDGLYFKILKRASDPAGRAAFVSFLQQGGTVEQAIVMMVTSPEYSTLTGGTDTGFISGLYTQLLGRNVSPAELAGWLALLPSLGRAGVATMLVQSAEFRTDMVQEMFGFTYALADSVVSTIPDLLHRGTAPPTAEINAWVNTGADLLTLRASLAATPEFIAFGSTGIIGQR
jgi:hypothetical protein